MKSEYERKLAVALEIALDAGVLERCMIHDVVFEGVGDIQHAFDLGAARLSTGALGQHFDSQDDMNEFIAEVVADHRSEECRSCREQQTEQVPDRTEAGESPPP